MGYKLPVQDPIQGMLKEKDDQSSKLAHQIQMSYMPLALQSIQVKMEIERAHEMHRKLVGWDPQTE